MALSGFNQRKEGNSATDFELAQTELELQADLPY